MIYRELGNTGLKVSEIGMGCEGFSEENCAMTKKLFGEIREIREGVKDFFRDVLEIFGDIILQVPIDKNFVDAWTEAFDADKKILKAWR